MPPPLRGRRRPVPGAARCSRRARRGWPPACCSCPCRATEPGTAPPPERPSDPLLPRLAVLLARGRAPAAPIFCRMRLSPACATPMALFRLAPASLSATSGILPAGSFASCAGGVMLAVFLVPAILAPGSQRVPWPMNACGRRTAFLTRTCISSAPHASGTSGANWVMRSAIAAGGALPAARRWRGTAPFVRRPAGLPRWSPMFLVLVPRRRAPSGRMIIPGSYRIGPNSGAPKSLRPHALHRHRCASPFPVVGLPQYSRKSALLQDGR